MPHHIELVTSAKDAINKVMGDISVDQDTTRASLEELQVEIETCLEMLDETDDEDSSLEDDEWDNDDTDAEDEDE